MCQNKSSIPLCETAQGLPSPSEYHLTPRQGCEDCRGQPWLLGLVSLSPCPGSLSSSCFQIHQTRPCLRTQTIIPSARNTLGLLLTKLISSCLSTLHLNDILKITLAKVTLPPNPSTVWVSWEHLLASLGYSCLSVSLSLIDGVSSLECILPEGSDLACLVQDQTPGPSTVRGTQMFTEYIISSLPNHSGFPFTLQRSSHYKSG